MCVGSRIRMDIQPHTTLAFFTGIKGIGVGVVGDKAIAMERLIEVIAVGSIEMVASADNGVVYFIAIVTIE